MKIAIAGLGLIGGSLGKALKLFNLKTNSKKYEILGIGRKQDTLSAAIKLGAADDVSFLLSDAYDSDIVVIAMPVDLTASVYKELAGIVKKGAIITDVGSTKSEIEKQIAKINKKGLLSDFVGAHPMTGKETNGISNAQGDLFEGVNVVISGSVNGSAKNEAAVAQMWNDTGAKIIKMAAAQHDDFVALTSHLPHLMAFALNKTYKDKKAKNPQIEKILAGSFYSAIRVASSSADMWAPIFEDNEINIKKNLHGFIRELKKLEGTLGDKNKTKRQILNTQK